MARFLADEDLNVAIRNIIEKASSELIIVSPYIKLHERIKSAFNQHINNPDLSIVVVFGKNEQDLSKSVSRDDLEFFTRFQNIQIKYESRLHAKYFANEISSLITSMNLYDYSQNNNVEVGILTEYQFIGGKTNDEASDYFYRMTARAKTIFDKRPDFEKGLMGLTKTYKGSYVICNELDAHFSGKETVSKANDWKTEPRTSFVAPTKPKGYCIRTGIPIDFNPEKPFSADAYKSWSKFSNPEYPEKFCHFSGEPSNGETTCAKPILRKNWQKAKQMHGI